MVFARYFLVLLGLGLCLIGAAQVQEGIPGLYVSRGIAQLQADANEILLGIAWLIGGLASGVFALAFPRAGTPAAMRPAAGRGRPAVSPDPASG